MPQCPAFPPIDPTVQYQTLTFDFGKILLANYPAGTTLSGTPTVTCVVAVGIDATPSARLIFSPYISTAPLPYGSGVANGAVAQQVGNLLPNVTYILQATCGISGSPDVESLWAELPCTPIC